MRERVSENERIIKTIESKRRDFYDYIYICIYTHIYIYIFGHIHTHDVIQPKYRNIRAWARARINYKDEKETQSLYCLVFYAKLIKVSKITV